MIKQYIFLLTALLTLLGCRNYKEVKYSDLKAAFVVNSSPTFKGYFYTGSDKHYHYFISKWSFKRDTYFKIAIEKLNVNNVLKFDKDHKELRIDFFVDSNILFAENEYYKLYIYSGAMRSE